MRILVTGASGFIGRACLGNFGGHEVLGTYRSNPAPGLERVDLLETNDLRALVHRFKPQAIVHCAARPSVDWCEENPDEARRLHVEVSLNVLRAAGLVGARVAFISTDYVFDGASGPYTERDHVNPINTYGRLKLEVEQALTADSARHLIARTTNVYGYDPRSKNFLMALLPTLAAGGGARVAQDQWGTPTHVEDLCGCIGAMLELGLGGVTHIAGPDLVDRVEWLKATARAFDLDPNLVTGYETRELAQPARRPLRAGLKTERLASLGIPVPRALREGLARMRAEKAESSEQAW